MNTVNKQGRTTERIKEYGNSKYIYQRSNFIPNEKEKRNTFRASGTAERAGGDMPDTVPGKEKARPTKKDYPILTDYLDAVRKWKRQAEREDEQLLILSPESGLAAALSALPFNLTDSKVANFGIKNILEKHLIFDWLTKC